MFDELKNDIETRMISSVSSAKSEMSGIRAGRASPSMLDSIKVDVYGQKMNINQVANITTPDSRTINKFYLLMRLHGPVSILSLVYNWPLLPLIFPFL